MGTGALVLSLVKFALSFADGLMKYLANEHLIEAGRHAEQAEGLKRALHAVQVANGIRDDVRAGKLQDPFLRD